MKHMSSFNQQSCVQDRWGFAQLTVFVIKTLVHFFM